MVGAVVVVDADAVVAIEAQGSVGRGDRLSPVAADDHSIVVVSCAIEGNIPAWLVEVPLSNEAVSIGRNSSDDIGADFVIFECPISNAELINLSIELSSDDLVTSAQGRRSFDMGSANVLTVEVHGGVGFAITDILYGDRNICPSVDGNGFAGGEAAGTGAEGE